jgi:hypothetical protein
MNTHYEHLEILLMMDTTLTSGELCKKDDPRPDGKLSIREQMEEACWNGYLQAAFPEICQRTSHDGNLYLWEVRGASSFLELDLGEVPDMADYRYSIIPGSFLSVQSYN